VPHNTQLREDILARILQRRGRAHVHSTIDAARAALVVIDMQHAFVEPGRPSCIPMAVDIVANINDLASACRAAGAPVCWVYTTFSESTLQDWSTFFGGVYDEAFSRAVIGNLSEGSEGHNLWSELDIQAADWRISKDRFSAFLPGHCNLEARLRASGVDTLIIAGTVTNVCCESSARDAVMRNFSVIMAADANAALSDDDHNASMNALAQTFGDVMDSEQIIERLHSNAAASA
jgi:ureidoacrylate peracid hydrolase